MREFEKIKYKPNPIIDGGEVYENAAGLILHKFLTRRKVDTTRTLVMTVSVDELKHTGKLDDSCSDDPAEFFSSVFDAFSEHPLKTEIDHDGEQLLLNVFMVKSILIVNDSQRGEICFSDVFLNLLPAP